MVVLMHAALTAAGDTIMVATAPARVGTWIPYTVSVLSACGAALLVATPGRIGLRRRQRAAHGPLEQVGSRDAC